MDYTVTVANTFEAESPEDAVVQMSEWLAQYAYAAGYRVEAEDGTNIFLDAENVHANWKGLD